MPQSIEMTRQQLYDLVWSRSVAAVAAGIPMSHLSLKKLCLKHQVPIPPLGHWRKSSTRQAADKVPLPLTMGPQRFWVKRALQRSRSHTPAAQRSESGLHECTENTKRALEQATTPNMRGALEAKVDGAASVIVAPETLPRALALLDDLIRAVEKLGYSVSTRYFPATLVVNGEHVPVAISEKFERNDDEPDAAELIRRKSYELRYPGFVLDMDFRNGWVHRPTGTLTITLGDGGGGRSLQRLWADTASHPVESRVGEVASAAIGHAQVIAARREKIEQRTAERRETEVQHRLEEKRIAFLDEHADSLEKAARRERLLQHLRRTGNGNRSQSMAEFMQWTEAHIISLRASCSALAMDRDVAESELWIADPAGGHH
jgi:hypothetical protein